VIRPFAIENEIDRFNLAMDSIKRVPKLQKIAFATICANSLSSRRGRSTEF
jgi:hypothetical protein